MKSEAKTAIISGTKARVFLGSDGTAEVVRFRNQFTGYLLSYSMQSASEFSGWMP